MLRFTNAPEMTEERFADLNRLIARYADFGLRCPAFLPGTDGRFFHRWKELQAYLRASRGAAERFGKACGAERRVGRKMLFDLETINRAMTSRE